MKKLLSVLLALVMVFSLTAPALAAAPDNDLDPPLWRIWGYDSYEDMTGSEYSYWNEERYAEALASILAFMEANPAETAQFRANAYTYFDEKYSEDWGTPQEFMTEWNETEEQFLTDMTVCQIWAYLSAKEYIDAWAAQCAEQPERTAQFLAELPTWFAEEYYYYDSFDEYVEYRTCKEEAYLELFSEWNWLYTFQQEQEQAKRDFITAHGGVPGQINVMVNGKCVSFPDAVPELTEGRTMVPVRAIAEALGAEMDYQSNEDIRCVAGGFLFTFAVGRNTVTVRPTAQDSTDMPQPDDITMDCAPYIKDGRTYIPVRFFAEALGYDVQWDSYYNTAVITDYTALAEMIDQDFTIYNKLMAKSALGEKTQKSVGSGKADITLFDTLNGDKTGKATYSYDLAASTAGASGKMEYDFTELWKLIEGYIPMPLDEGDYAEEYAKTMELVKSLMKGTLDVRVDLEKGKAYLSMPGLFEALGDYLEESGVQLPKDAWLSASLGDGAGLDELTGMLGQTTTIGRLLTATAGSAYFPAKNYDFILEAAEQFGALFGDAKFTRRGSSNVLTLTKADLVAMAGDDAYAAGELDALSKFEYTLTVKDNGDMDVSSEVRVAMTGSGLNLGDMMELTVKGTVRGGKTDETVEVHVKNVLKATITLQQTVTETDEVPETTPPDDALVLPVDGTLPGGTVTSPDGPTQGL